MAIGFRNGKLGISEVLYGLFDESCPLACVQDDCLTAGTNSLSVSTP